MVNRKKAPTQIDRWDKEVLMTCRNMFPKSSAAEISRILYNTSLCKYNKEIIDWNDRLEVKFGIRRKTKKR